MLEHFAESEQPVVKRMDRVLSYASNSQTAKLDPHVPDDTVRRRYSRGLQNFFRLYLPLATTWGLYSNLDDAGLRLIAKGGSDIHEHIVDPAVWTMLKAEAEHETEPH